MKKKFCLALVVLLAVSVFVGSALANGALPFTLVWTKETESQAGPDSVYWVETEGVRLLCVKDAAGVSCVQPIPPCLLVCPASAGPAAQSVASPTATPRGERPGPSPTAYVSPTPGFTNTPLPSPTRTPQPTNTSVPTNTPQPTATEEPEYNGVWITHYDGQGNEVWTKCMPPSAVNGHRPDHSSHRGHPIPDVIGGGCYR